MIVPLLILAALRAQAAEGEPAPYRIEYADGVIIEIVAVSVTPSRGKPFWSPDGRKLLQAPYELWASSLPRNPRAPQTWYEVVARISGVREQPIYMLQRAENGLAIGYGTSPNDRGAQVKDLRVFECGVPQGTEVLDFELAIAANAWETTHTFKGPGVYGSGPAKAEVVETTPRDAGIAPNAWFRVNVVATESALRLIAVDDTGSVHVSKGAWWQGRDGHGVEAVFPDVSRDKVKEYRLQRAAYEWKAIKGIRLKPDGDWPALLARHRVERLVAREARFKPADVQRVHDAIDKVTRLRVLKHNVLLEAKNKKGETPLHKAVGYFDNKGAVLAMLLEHKADVLAKDADGRTPLHRAVMVGSLRATTALLEDGADARAKDEEGATPLHYAAKNGRDALIPLLLKHGAAINESDGGGRTPLDWATRKQTKELLTASGAKGKE
jgi:hypothetical protein